MTATVENLLGSGDQESQLDDALMNVKREAFEMKRCLDRDNVLEALKHASNMLSELKTNVLSPKFYYRLYIDSMNELGHLESFLSDLAERKKMESELYEHVQYAGSIIPRLYLMTVVGVVQIKSGMAGKAEMLHDLVEMSRGVQHPLRGLFLRNYLLQSTRNLLPEEAVASKPEDGTINDAINFILTNFSEMNKLWVRMQHQGPSKEKEKRERERLELRILVGTNMVRLSQLEGLTVAIFEEHVLPAILEQVVSCHDAISQEYLMECVVQVFPDDFHLATLRDLLEACEELHEEVNMKNVLGCVMERVQSLAASSHHSQLFSLFANSSRSLIAKGNMPVQDIVTLHLSLAKLALKCYPEQVEYINTVIDSLVNILKEKDIKEQSHLSPVGREVVKVLECLIDGYGHVSRINQISSFVALNNVLDLKTRCRVSANVLQTMMDKDLSISTQEDLDALERVAGPVIEDDGGILSSEDLESEDFVEEQNIVGRSIHLVRDEKGDPDAQFILLSNVRKLLGKGGKTRIEHTLPCLLFALFSLVRLYKEKKEDIENWDVKMKKLFMVVMSTIKKLHELDTNRELPLRLYVEAALVADSVPFEEQSSVVYEFLSKSLSMIEEELSDSRVRVSSLSLLCSSLSHTQSLPIDDVIQLANHITLVSSNLFKKADQVRALTSSAFLFWNGKVSGQENALRDGHKVHSILVKALKTLEYACMFPFEIAAQCMEPLVQVQLMILILESMHSLYAQGCEEVTEDELVEVVGRIKENSSQLERNEDTLALEKHVTATLKGMSEERARGGSIASRLRL